MPLCFVTSQRISAIDLISLVSAKATRVLSSLTSHGICESEGSADPGYFGADHSTNGLHMLLSIWTDNETAA